MVTPLRLTLIGLLAYGLFLIVQLPASLLFIYWQPPAGWQLDEPRGSVWDGEIAHLARQGRSLGSLHWELSPGHLLLGELQADWVWDGPYGTARGAVGYGLFDRQPVLQDVATDLDMSLLSDLGRSPLPLQGQIQGNVLVIDLFSNDYPVIIGQMRWQQAGLEVGETLSLGQVSIQASEQQGHSRLALSNVPGEVAVQGGVKLLPAGRIDVDLQLRPQNAHGRELLKLAQSLGKASPDGSLRIRYLGTLPWGSSE